jgi:hypothetical protein
VGVLVGYGVGFNEGNAVGGADGIAVGATQADAPNTPETNEHVEQDVDPATE